MEQKGKVWLAGAGPGDAGLLTVKTRQLMESVDIIVYDALISAEILSLIPADKEMVHVGKRSGHHMVPQEETNQILLAEALKGKKVLRLKGGDPFVFGRGGEELELLKEHGIPFEIVPGITSAAAVPAYAGIPITHREYTSSFHVITGHPRKDGTSRVDYPSLVNLKGTLVFLMGISSMETILIGLMEAGMDPSVPAAVLEKGTLSSQRRVVSTVGNLAKEAKKAEIGTPAIILVGEVCALADLFHWAEDRPLGGRQILITRPRENSSRLADRLRALGAQVIELPSIDTKTISPNPALSHAMKEFGYRTKEEWLVFTSPIGVRIFFEQMVEMKMDLRKLFACPAKVKIAAIGSATERELRERGLFADLVPAVYCAEDLGKEIAVAAEPGSRVTIVRASIGSQELLPPLEKAGLEVVDTPLYETIYETHEQIREKIQEQFKAGEIDMVTFTSASTVKGFVHALRLEDYRPIHAVCIGEQTAAEARKYGMRISISKKASIDSMVELILEEA
ncbi:uroporphyrinogen-III C-methyltransferase [Faecalicatena sp. AGMB00832]|uniref:uroporphyrinogen-III C-methyltransferase n=1 Tax=Faecalicatena faecalis TaxID=2726362 RepID=A0ABS6D3X8_9FIRM|nr:uroporphyrinogen-III C-methyltransferase [Faecalicatena faecalis]MBU3876025.1 uroporphyrinogen-III C-methyltransferase [Faecalicatena faecalis]